MQTEIGDQDASQNLRVYAVWLPMLVTDARDEWNGMTMPDSRVMHFWDGETEIGQWFAEKLERDRAIAWDVYYLYGPDAVWDELPSPLIGSGSPIYAERETLRTELDALLEK